MPLDAGQPILVNYDELAEIGVTSVPAALIEAHKTKMKQKYRKYPRAVWLLDDFERGSLQRKLREWRAPKSVREIAEYVKQTMPSAQFAIGYFYTDPYLQVTYGNQVAYLGLWMHRWWAKSVAKRQA